MHRSVPIRLYVLILTVCFLWAILGAPLSGQEWRELPSSVLRLIRQWPSRTQPVWRQWLLHAQAENISPDIMLRIWDQDSQQAISLPLERYVQGVTAAEMPAGYHPEALKCQAVVARTRAIFACMALGGNGCRSHPDCDLCTNAACCQGYIDEAARRARWGEEYANYDSRIAQAVSTTAGQILTWNGLPAEMLYHACSGGITEDAAEVFSQNVPYLISVQSPGEEHYTGFEAEVSMSRAEAAQRLCAAFPDCGLTADDIPGALRLQSTTASGRIDQILVGDTMITGHQFRQALGLRSAMCTWDAYGDTITFHTQGYGHGVGMSQAGAQAMAGEGCGYQDILAHYYPGTSLTALPV